MNSTLSRLTAVQDSNSYTDAFSLAAIAALFQMADPDEPRYELPSWTYLDTEVSLPSEVIDLYKSITEQTIWPREDEVDEILPIEKVVEKRPIGLLEVYSDRPFFYYSCRERSTTCSYGHFTLSCTVKNMQQVTTYTSALDVYDRYGLAICTTYLKSLYCAVASGSYSATSLLMYTVVSMAALDMERAQFYSQQLREASQERGCGAS